MNSSRVLNLLRQFESRNVTFVDPDGTWPIVWERAKGTTVWDAEGRAYLDLTAAFGVAAAGHANPRVVRAGCHQMTRLLHAMGDVHPHELKALLARELSRLTFGRWRKGGRGKIIFCNSGFEAVESALKTAILATRKPGIVAFEGAYHGLGYGALNATHRPHFRGPFRSQLGEFGQFLPFPSAGRGQRERLAQLESRLTRLLRTRKIGAVLVEPIQVRGGVRIPPPQFLRLVRRLCDRHGALLVLDEIYTGFGRTGRWFACEYSGVSPDLLCLGKALTGGFPLSACVGRADLMDAAWPESAGEAIHTSTFLGHPVGCAMALAQISELRRLNLPERSARNGRKLLEQLRAEIPRSPWLIDVRGLGLLAGVEIRLADGGPATAECIAVLKRLLRDGFILLPEGEHGNVISFTPPLTISERQLAKSVRALANVLRSFAANTHTQ